MPGMGGLIQSLADDLLPPLDDSPEVELYTIKDENARIEMTAEGIDFDNFRNHYRDGSLGLLKALRDFTREYKALGGILLEKSDKGLVPAYSIGINEDGVDTLAEDKHAALLSELTAEKGIVYIRNKDHYSLGGAFSHNDFNLFKKLIILPLKSEEGIDAVLLGYKDKSQTFLKDLY